MQTKNLILTAIFTTLMIISSYIVLPIGPVPITFQPFMVLLIGMLLGPKLGPLSIGVWILLGCLGLPVFNQGQAGAVMLIGPTGGFIISFMVMAWLVGFLTIKNTTNAHWKNLFYMLLAMVVCYAMGLIGFKLSFAYVLHKPMTWEKSFMLAVAPFLPLDLVKAALAAFIGSRVRSALWQAGLLPKMK